MCPQKSSDEAGYIMITILLLTVVAMLTLTMSLSVMGDSLRTHAMDRIRDDRFFEAEASVAKTLAWMRKNSQKLTNICRPEEIYDQFELGDPDVGSNDVSRLNVPSRVRKKNTNNSVFLANNNSLGTADFGTTIDITTEANWDAQGSFTGSDLGNGLVRVSLITAFPVDPSKDYGPPPSPMPETVFNAIYRIDVLTDAVSGTHLSADILAEPIPLFTYGVYGQDYLEFRQPCDSYDSEAGPYNTSTNRNANCGAGSNSDSQIHKNEALYGFLETNGPIVEESPYGGDVCADFQAGCPNEGRKCSGEDCGVPLLEQFSTYSVYCSSNQGPLVVGIGDTVDLTITGTTRHDRCWSSVEINRDGTLILSDTAGGYYFESIDFKHGTAALEADPDTAGKYVDIYVGEIVGDKINGNQVINASARPFSLRMYYLGTNALTLNGNAAMYMGLVAPRADIYVTGSFEYYGALMGKTLRLNGSGSIHYDESLAGASKVNDYKYTLMNVRQIHQ